MIQHLNNLEETRQLSKSIAGQFKGGEVIGLVGELGSGKTTLVQFLAEALGIKEKVASPTFVLMKVYRVNKPQSAVKQLVHVDAYRLNNSEELKNIGLLEYVGRLDSVVVIEWADRVQDILPQDSTMIEIKEGETEGQRIVEISQNERLTFG